MSNNSIWLIDRSLSDATVLGQSGPESESNEGYSTFPKASVLLEPHHQIVQNYIQDIHWVGILPLCRDAVSVILQSQLSGLKSSFSSGKNGCIFWCTCHLFCFLCRYHYHWSNHGIYLHPPVLWSHWTSKE